ncbi:glycosyltransferase [Bacillus pacificus]|uniref:glycosyltransferase family 2 protein n=1 Tax=Bacillus pacificus TaxID=2026187 RepID=UPI003D1E72D0
MKLTIAFITKNRCNELKKAINSCLSQRFGELQLVFVDNGSTDETVEYLEGLKKENQINIKIFKSKSNLGVAGGRNKAMEISDGDYVFFLDDDAVIESEDLLLKICEYMDGNQQVGALALKTYEEITERYLEGALPKHVQGEIVDTLQFIGCAHVLRRSVFNNQKLYPEKLGYGSEELYASLRIWNLGYSIKYFRDVMIRHVPSKSNRLDERERQYNILTNIYVVKMLTYPTVFRMLTKCVFIVRLVKNRYADKETRKRFKIDVANRYQSHEVDRLSYRQLLRLGNTYGWRNII